MKKTFSLSLLCASLVLALIISLPPNLGLYAAAATPTPPPSTNIDGGGGGGTGSGSGSSAWDGGDDGVRVTVLQGSTPVAIVDYSKEQRSRTQKSFSMRCKLDYLRDLTLYPIPNQYTNKIPTFPWSGRIISTSGTSNVEAIKSYFTDQATVENLARDVGMNYTDLVSGQYKLMLEPIAYFKYNGSQYAMTATEAALFDIKVGGDLRSQMGTLTHQNQPFSMFLERADLGIQPWRGTTSGKQSNNNILQQLGVGIVSFTLEDVEIDEPESSTGDYTYRTDTDVITAVSFRSGGEISPDDNAYITFDILGRRYNKQFICPAGKSQLVWVKWHTPDTPQDVTIRITSAAISGLNTTRTASIVKLEEKTPPDPQYEDTNTRFRLQSTPDWGSQTRTEWSQWVPYWHEEQYNGLFTEPGYWTYSKQNYSAALSVDYALVPDERVKTGFRISGGRYEMKSGYGVNANCAVTVSGAGGTTNNDISPVQNAVAVFPDFDFQTYSRLLEPERDLTYRTNWHFKMNKYSYYLNPVHFTPIWYPDGKNYVVPLAVFDAWTPGGQLYTSVSDYVRIDGGCALDDWYIRTLK